MSKRLQVLVSEALDARIAKAAQRLGEPKGAWVRRALEKALAQHQEVDPLEKLESLGAPTADIEDMLAEIESGRS